MIEQNFLTNQFLLAMPALTDPNFQRGVVYICEHSKDGAIGVVINHPIVDITVGDILEHIKIPCDSEAVKTLPVFHGGPMHSERCFVLHQRSKKEKWQTSLYTSEELIITTSPDVLAALAANKGPKKILVVLGYAAWQPGQLEVELRNNVWLSMPATTDIIFDVPVQKRWQQAASRIGVDFDKLMSYSGNA